MSDSIFLDSNVLVYAYDRSEPAKQKRAMEVLKRLGESGDGVISIQVLAEFFVSVTRKIAAPLSVVEASERVQNLLAAWTVVDLTGLIVLEAVRGIRDHSFHYWGAQIWATARLNQIPVVFSEDLSPDSNVEGVHFVNPFAQGFQFEAWM